MSDLLKPRRSTETGAVITDIGRRYLRRMMVPDIGPIRLHRLLKHFGSLDAVHSASQAELQAVASVGSKTARSIFENRGSDTVDREVARAADCGVRVICREDASYPPQLLQMADPPPCLYIRGTLEPTDAVGISIVGTRRCSHYGVEQANRFAALLARAGFTVVSGLARGVGSHAHRGALAAGGRTIAVLGNGLATVYPPEHAALADEIADRGAILSELPIDTGPDRKNFPGRNRIIAGLTLGVSVIEAGKNSGALITARCASEYNREVFALPGRVDDPANTAGTNRLIRDGGAKLITCLEDVLDELGDVGRIMQPDEAPANPQPGAAHDTRDGASPAAMPGLNETERAVFDAITNGHDHPDSISAHTNLDITRVTATLTGLQLKGAVKGLPGGRFAPHRR